MAEPAAALPNLLTALRHRWRFALALTMAVTTGGVIAGQSLPDEYTAEAVLSFSPKPDTSAGADTVRVVLPKYVAYVSARATTNEVAAALGEDPDDLAAASNASVAADSGNLTINVTSRSAQRAAVAANQLAAATVGFATEDALLDVVSVASALPPSAPSGPPRRLLQIAALVVGAFAAVVAALLLERGRPRVHTWRDIPVVTGHPVIARVPAARVLRGPTAEALANPAVGASVRTLRTNLINLEDWSRHHPVGALVVTSSRPGEGKTTIAAALALSLARIDANVLLIDGDLRRPAIDRHFGLKASPGLTEVLRAEVKLEAAIRPGPEAGLSILPTGPDAEAGDLLGRNFAHALSTARQQFDIVIIDAPPLLVGDDARTLTTICGSALFVVPQGAPAHAVIEAASVLDRLRVRTLGVVANRVREPRGAPARARYGTYGIDGS